MLRHGRGSNGGIQHSVRSRIEPDQVHRTHEATIDQFLSASAIASYTFCPQAWSLQRRGTRRSPGATALLATGTRNHQHIGRRTDRLRAADMSQRLLLALIALLVLVVVLAQLTT